MKAAEEEKIFLLIGLTAYEPLLGYLILVKSCFFKQLYSLKS